MKRTTNFLIKLNPNYINKIKDEDLTEEIQQLFAQDNS